jgi:hypothetical protein
MKLKTAVGLIVATAIVFSSVGVGAAQAAVEGPFFQVGGSRLASGESQEVTGEAGGGFYFQFYNHLVKVQCSKASVLTTSKIFGSSGANGGGGEDVLWWSGCAVSEPAQCHLKYPSFKASVTNRLAYSSASRSGKVEMLLSPSGSSKTLTTVIFEEGTGCPAGGSLPITGSWATKQITSGEKVVEIGSEPAASSTLWPFFEGSGSPVFTESEGKLTEVRPQLTSPVGAVWASGALNMTLKSGSLWGIFS